MLNAHAAAGWLPRLLVTRPGAADEGEGAGEAARFAAAVLWLDVSGFTTLSEVLGEQGPAGAERLSELLNERFGALIDVIARHGGDITHFAGDAICAVWPAAADASMAQGVRRAAQAALAFQALPDDPGRRAQEPPLRVRTGVAAGVCAWTRLGDGDEGFFVVGGAPPARAAAAAAAGQPGEVIVAATAWPLLAGAVERGGRTPAGDARLGALPAGAEVAGEAPGAPAPDPDRVTRFLPRVLRERLVLSGGWLAEFRRVTVLFVGFGAGDFAAPAQHAAAQAQLRVLRAAVARFDGTVHQLVAEERGATLIAAWGLAGVTHEDDARRGVEAALALHAELGGLGVPCAVGIATGRLFCGVRGSDARREWALVGDRMNLAARLMRAAGGGVLCDDGTAQAAAARLRFEALAPIALKGKARPVAVFRPLAGARTPASATAAALVGRASEGARFDRWLRDAREQGRGGVRLIEGEAGIGKSALLADLAQRAAAQGWSVLRGEGDAVDSATAYFAWRGVLRALLALLAPHVPHAHAGHDALVRALGELLADEPAARERMALLDDVLALGLPPSATTAAMAPQGRADALQELVGALLRRAAARAPLLVAIDDAHWLDSASWSLLAAAARRAPAVCFAAAARPLPGPQPAALRRLLAAGAQRLPLAPLAPTDTLRVVCARLGVAALPRAVEALIVERAQGNPFFSEQLALALRDAGQLVVEAGACRLARPAAELAACAVPDTVQGVVTSRIDRLHGDAQLTLKVAAVIGRVFGERVLGDVHPAAPAAPELGAQLRHLQQMDFTRPQAPPPEPTHLFSHAITQQVAYDLMIHAQRRQMHRAIALWFEQRFAGVLEPQLPLLAHHWTQAGDARRAVPYLERSAAQALERFANAEVLRFVAQALALAAQAQLEIEPARRARWSWYQGEALLKLARYADSRTHFVDALQHLGQPVPASRARLAARLAAQTLLQWGHRLRGGARAARDAERETLLLCAHLHQRLAEVGYWGHDIVTLVHSAMASLNLAERAGPSRQLQLAFHVVGFVAGLAGSPALQRSYTRRAAALTPQVGHVETDAFGAQLDAIYCNGQARWDEMEAAARRAGSLFERIGERFRRQTCVVLRAWGALHRGDDARALSLFDEALAMVGHEGPTQVQLWGRAGRVAVDLARGGAGVERAPLEALLVQGVDHSDAILCHGLLALAHARTADAAASARHAARAADLIDRWPPASFHTLLGNAAVVQVRRMAWLRAHDARSTAELHRALRGLQRLALACPIGRPFLWRARAAQALAEGRGARAERCRRRAAAEAQRLGMRALPGWD